MTATIDTSTTFSASAPVQIDRADSRDATAAPGACCVGVCVEAWPPLGRRQAPGQGLGEEDRGREGEVGPPANQRASLARARPSVPCVRERTSRAPSLQCHPGERLDRSARCAVLVAAGADDGELRPEGVGEGLGVVPGDRRPEQVVGPSSAKVPTTACPLKRSADLAVAR